KVLKEAVRIVRSLDLDVAERALCLSELRNEATACLAHFDGEKHAEWPGQFTVPVEMDVDSKREKYAQGDSEGNVLIRRAGDGQEILRIPAAQLLLEPVTRPLRVGCRFSPDDSLLAIRYYHPPRGDYFVLWNLREHKKVIPGTQMASGGQTVVLAF